jgi:predicted RNase H-like HicB family nuclease
VIRTYSLIIEGDGAGYSAYVPELPTVVVTGNSIEDLTARARVAIQLYWEALRTDSVSGVNRSGNWGRAAGLGDHRRAAEPSRDMRVFRSCGYGEGKRCATNR